MFVRLFVNNLESLKEFLFTPPVDAPTKDLINWPTIFSISAREDEEHIHKEVGEGNEDSNEDCEDSDEEEESDDDDGQVKGFNAD